MRRRRDAEAEKEADAQSGRLLLTGIFVLIVFVLAVLFGLVANHAELQQSRVSRGHQDELSTAPGLSGTPRPEGEKDVAAPGPGDRRECRNGGMVLDGSWQHCPHPDHVTRVYDTAEQLYLLCECPGPTPVLVPPDY